MQQLSNSRMGHPNVCVCLNGRRFLVPNFEAVQIGKVSSVTDNKFTRKNPVVRMIEFETVG